MVLLDIVMPVMDGLTALTEMNRLGYLRKVPVVMVTAESTEGISLRMYELGASDVISKPFNPAVVRQRVNNILELYDYRSDLEDIVRRQTVTLEEQADKLKKTNVFVIDTLCTAVEFRNGESGTHIVRLRDITLVLLKEFGRKHSQFSMSDMQIEIISNAAAMHDIGKIAVPDAILNKPGRLTHEEFAVMKLHTVKGCELLEKLDYVQDQEYFEFCYEICRHHHERWDGRGYPDGIAGEAIPIWSQVVALADVYDALVSERSYKKAFSHEKAMSMIEGGECGQFNPELLKVFVEIGEVLREMYQSISASVPAPVTPLTIVAPKADENLQRILKLLEIERAKYHIIADTSGDIVLEYNVAEDKVLLSENINHTFDWPIEHVGILKSTKIPSVIYEKDFRFLQQAFNEIKNNKGKTVRKTFRLKTRSGHFEWFELVAQGFFNEEGERPELTDIVGKLVNINELKKEAAHWRTDAQRDSLTSLNSRAAFQERVTAELEKNPECDAALFLIDVDDFKHINDAYGHQTGDKILRYVAEKLRSTFRSSDIIGRSGGDEFMVFLPGTMDARSLHNKAKSICDAFTVAHREVELDSECQFTGSVGVARYPYDAVDYPMLVRHTDEALFRAKANGKNQYAFFESK
jgi:putative two-component system response regulator